MRPARLAMDLAPLRDSRDFRLLFAGLIGALFGTLMTSVAVAVQVCDLTESAAHIGLVSLARALPMVVGVLAGGVLADRYDRRLLMLATRPPLTLVAASLAVNALLPEPQLWLIYTATALTGLSAGFGGPAMLAAIPALVGTERLAAAGALTSASRPTTPMGRERRKEPRASAVTATNEGLQLMVSCFANSPCGLGVTNQTDLFTQSAKPYAFADPSIILVGPLASHTTIHSLKRFPFRDTCRLGYDLPR